MVRLKLMIRATRWLNERRADAVAIASLVLFFLAFFPQGVFGGRYLLAGDNFFYSYPMHTVAWRMIREGQLPLWSPYTLSGYPLLSMTQLGLAYPLTWGHSFLPSYVAEQIYVLAPFLLVPIFTYLYLRTVGRSPLAATLGALSFGYGGMMANPIGNSGMMTNAVLWLPLLLIGIERSRKGRFLPALFLATAAYTMSVLNGFAQGFVYAGILALGYASWLVLKGVSSPDSATSLRDRISTTQAWRPVLVVIGAALLSAGVAAFQILETARVVRRSVRSSLDYFSFTQGSLPPTFFLKSIIAPFFYWIDMHAYVPPLVLGFAVVAVFAYFRKPGADPRVLFWMLVAILACLLMLGSFTPLYKIVYRIPIVNLFRVPSRHTFEWTFAASVLAAYGWDTVGTWLSQKQLVDRRRTLHFVISLVLLGASIVVGVLWWRWVAALPSSPELRSTNAFSVYIWWKIAFVLATLATLWTVSRIVEKRLRFGMALVALLVLCFVEPSAMVNRWWAQGFDASRFNTISEATNFLKQFPPEQGRVYTRVDMMSEQYGSPPRYDCPNFSALWGLHNVGGYEPLLLDRYSRALGDVGLDTVRSLKTGVPDSSLLSNESHVLDILNTSFIISYQNLALSSQSDPTTALGWSVQGELLPQTTKTFASSPVVADSLEFVTTLSNSTEEPDDAVIARVEIFTTKGDVIERELRAGRDTAEWAHDRPDVRPFIKHRLAPIFDQVIVGEPNGYPAYRYKTSVPFGEPLEVLRFKVSNVSTSARLGIYSALVTDSKTQKRVPLYSLSL